jgi:DNA-binding NarL/FixJ family response regulator
MPLTYKLLLVDDHQMLLDGIKSLLAESPKFKVVAQAHNGVQALQILNEQDIDVILTDISMPEMDGISLAKAVQSSKPNVKVVVLSMMNDTQNIREMIDAGVKGYILKNTGKIELISALEKVAAGGIYFSDEVTTEMMRAVSENLHPTPMPEASSPLTAREKDVLQLVAKELSNAQIAESLNISERTVETHRKNIFRKTNTKGVIGLIKYAYEHQLI